MELTWEGRGDMGRKVGPFVGLEFFILEFN